jgi:hypothetical protein
MSTRRVNGKRSFTGNHPLLPAARPAAPPFIPKVPTYAFLKWTFGRGSVVCAFLFILLAFLVFLF